MRRLCIIAALTTVLVAPPALALQPRQRPTAADGASGPPPQRRPTQRRPTGRRPPGRRPGQPAPKAEPELPPAEDLDRAVIRWYAQSRGGAEHPKFITARELAFEARLEALTSHSSQTASYSNKDIRAAVQRHISESMLASLPVSVKPTPKQVASYAERARELIAQRIASELEDKTVEERRVYGLQKLDAARRAEGISREELDSLLRRRARASWYLDQMVAPMLKPTELDLREAHLRGETPFTAQPFDQVRDAIERWYVSARLAAALDRYFRNVRSRVHVVVIHRPPRAETKTTRATPKPSGQRVGRHIRRRTLL